MRYVIQVKDIPDPHTQAYRTLTIGARYFTGIHRSAEHQNKCEASGLAQRVRFLREK